MGLESYLFVRKKCTKFLGKPDENYEKVIEIFPEIFDCANYSAHSGIYVKFIAGYFQKVNHIHRWFVENVQKGNDDCKEYYFNRHALRELRKLSKQVIKEPDKAPLLLPTMEGFFFGSEEYGEEYFEETKDFLKVIEKCLKLPKEWDFLYWGWW